MNTEATKPPPAIATPPRRYCARCREAIPADRVARGAYFCGDLCRNADKAARRAVKAGTKCRLCGRRFNRRQTAADTPANEAAASPGQCCAVAQPGRIETMAANAREF